VLRGKGGERKGGTNAIDKNNWGREIGKKVERSVRGLLFKKTMRNAPPFARPSKKGMIATAHGMAHLEIE